MNSLHNDAIRYMVPRRESFWRWTKGAQSVEWKDGRTIAFRQEIAEVIASLAPGQLPRFDAILLLLAACRDNWNAADNTEQMLSSYGLASESEIVGVQKPGGRIVSSLISRAVRIDLTTVIENLNRVAELPAELRQSLRAKCVIAETVFETAVRPIPSDTAEAIVRALIGGFDPETLLAADGSDDTYRHLDAELVSLRTGLAKLDAEWLRLRLMTGLDQFVEPAPIDLPDAVRVRNLLTQLRDDPELAGVTRLARNLLAAIHMPRALAAPQDLPVGGVSDLSNRGPLDRLLVSELAHDDLTLTTRIALNEALYLRREAPRSIPPRDRIILIDCGIRLWGVPRVFAVAVALALAASLDKRAKVRSFRSANKTAEPANLLTREGLLAQLQALDPSPHPAEAIRAMFKSFDNDARDADVMLVTHEDVSTDADFIRGLREIEPEREWQLAIVDRAGGFRLEQLNRACRRMLCTAQLSLDDLLTSPGDRRPVPTPLLDKRIDPLLPVILSTNPFPLLLPAFADPRRAVVSRKYGLLSATHDGRLMRWLSERKGATQLCPAAPPGTFIGLYVDDESGVIYYVSRLTPPGEPAQSNVLLLQIETGSCRQMTIDSPAPLQAAACHGGVLLLLYDRRMIALDAEGATIADHSAADAYRWGSSRFYRGPQGWYAAHFDGHGIQLSPVTERNSVAVFDREGEGPWQLMKDGTVAAAGGPPLVVIKLSNIHGAQGMGISSDGHRILRKFWHMPSQRYASCFLDLNELPLKWRLVELNAYRLLVGDAINWSERAGVNVHRKFDCIYLGAGGDIFLIHGTRRFVIRLHTSGNLRLDSTTKEDDELGVSTSAFFGHGRRPAGMRFKLRTASWADGSRAYLDSRGILHLKSSHKSLPEISIILANGGIGLGGWTSDGHTFGSAYFHHTTATTPGDYINRLLRDFAARLR